MEGDDEDELLGSQDDPLAGPLPPQDPEPTPEEAAAMELEALKVALPPAVLEPAMVPTLEALTPKCRACGEEVNALERGVRYFIKCKTFQCPKCSTRHVGIIKVFGTAKFPEFQGLGDEEKKEFFKSLPTDCASIKLKCSELIIKVRLQTRKNSIVGKFLPLAVWEKKGFDIASIRDHAGPSDMEEHPVLGLTYRVRVRQQTDEEEASIRKQVNELQRPTKKKKRKAQTRKDTDSQKSSVESPPSDESDREDESEEERPKRKKRAKAAPAEERGDPEKEQLRKRIEELERGSSEKDIFGRNIHLRKSHCPSACIPCRLGGNCGGIAG